MSLCLVRYNVINKGLCENYMECGFVRGMFKCAQIYNTEPWAHSAACSNARKAADWRCIMKINEIMKERRKEMGLTQEQIADRLGVSAPAVNKWEKGTSYPDITLLPALARLLGTDLNTLLSFKEELTDREIAGFCNEITDTAMAGGLDQAFTMAFDKLHEYPNCDLLILNMALMLEGLLIFYPDDTRSADNAGKIQALYERAAKSTDLNVRNQAQAMLVSKYMKHQEYDKAEALLEEIPDATAFNKRQLQANLYVAQNDIDKAIKITEERLLTETNNVLSALFTLNGIALKNEAFDDAEYIADRARDFTKLFDLWDYSAYVAYLDVYTVKKDAKKCMDTLEKLLIAATKPWNYQDSPLYRHVAPAQKQEDIKNMILPRLLSEIEDPGIPEYDFLRNAPEYPEFIARLKSQLDTEMK